MIRFATSKDIEQIKSLWKNTFYDDDKYIDFYIENCFETNRCLMYIENNCVCSMLFLIDCEINHYSGKYIYAACTDKNFRSHGYMAKLLEYVKSGLDTCYDFVCLVPANDGLFKYYSKFGFKKYFANSIVELANNYKPKVEFEDISFNEFSKLRNIFYGTRLVKWNNNALEYAFNENLFNGGRNIKIGDGYAIINEQNDVCRVLEWASGDFDLNIFTDVTKCDKIIIQTFVDDNTHCNGMILTNSNIDDGKMLSLVLD